MKKLFYSILTCVFLFSCVFSNKEKATEPVSVKDEASSPEPDVAPSTGEHINVDTSMGRDNLETKAEPANTNSPTSEPAGDKGGRERKEMSSPPPPMLDTVAVH